MDPIKKCINDMIMVLEYNLNHGDIIKVSRMNNLYYHYGVYYENGNVIHLSGEVTQGVPVSDSGISIVDEMQQKCAIEIIPLTDFQLYKTTQIIVEKQTQFINRDKINDLLGFSPYNLITYNCEHFANYITNDTHKSGQVIRTIYGGANAITLTLTYILLPYSYLTLAITPFVFGIQYILL